MMIILDASLGLISHNHKEHMHLLQEMLKKAVELNKPQLCGKVNGLHPPCARVVVDDLHEMEKFFAMPVTNKILIWTPVLPCSWVAIAHLKTISPNDDDI